MEAPQPHVSGRRRGVPSALIVATGAVLAFVLVGLAIVLVGRSGDETADEPVDVERTEADVDDGRDDDADDDRSADAIAVEVSTIATEVWNLRTGFVDVPDGALSEPGERWEFRADRLDDVVGDASVVALLDAGRNSSDLPAVIAIDPASGEVMWQQDDLPGNGYVSTSGDAGDLKLFDAFVQVGYTDDDDNDWTLLLDRADGRIVLELEGVGWWATGLSGDVLVEATSRVFVGRSISTGEELWRLDGGGLESEYEGALYFSTRVDGPESVFEAGPIDVSDGTLLWTHAAPGDVRRALFNDTFFAARSDDQNPELIAVDPDTGVERWTETFGTAGLRVTPASTTLTAVSGSELWGVDSDGQIVWQTAAAGDGILAVRVADRSFVLSLDAVAPRLIDGDTGEVVATGRTQISSRAQVAAGIVYDVNDRVLTATELTTMETLWQIPVGDDATLVSSVGAGVVMVDGDRITTYGG